MQIQWYPGHMAKALRQMKEDIGKVDLCIELLDARAPFSTGNPEIRELAARRYRLVLLNKADLAEEAVTEQWFRFFRAQGIRAVALDARSRKGMKELQKAVDEVCEGKYEQDRKRGLLERPVRAMVAGIPNVGKSTLINSLSGKAAAKTGNKPGVTKGNQWIRLNRRLDLLDTPGVLWPRFDSEAVGLRLAWIGAVNDEILPKEELAYRLVRFLLDSGRQAMLEARYETDPSVLSDPSDPNAWIETIAVKRGFLKKGGEADLTRTAARIIEEFRAGTIGRISLETPDETEQEENV